MCLRRVECSCTSCLSFMYARKRHPFEGRQEPPNENWCRGCSPETCSGCADPVGGFDLWVNDQIVSDSGSGSCT